MRGKIGQDKRLLLLLLLLVVFTGWWAVLNLGHQVQASSHEADWFLATYALIALVGGMWGLKIAKQWGGWQSLLGRAMTVFSLGLLAQVFGQLGCAYYAIAYNTTVPYPSFADLAYLGSSTLYVYGSVLLARIARVSISLSRWRQQMLCFLVPLIALTLVHISFLKIDFTAGQPLVTLLNLGYLCNQVLYVAFVLLILLESRRRLGGVMHHKLLLLLLAPAMLYLADINFFWQAAHGTLLLADYGDLLYLAAHGLITVALLNTSTRAVRSAQQSQAKTRPASPKTLDGPRVSERLRLKVPGRKKLALNQPS